MRYNITKIQNQRISCISILFKVITRVIKYINIQEQPNMERLHIQIDLKRIIIQITLYKYLFKYTTQVNDIQQINTYTYTI